MSYVYSTLAVDMHYTNAPTVGADGKIVDDGLVIGSVFIAGKANIPDKHLYTVRGVSTRVTDEQLNILTSNRVFQLHKKNGFITVDQSKQDADKVAKDMNPNDKSAPDTEEKLKAEGKQAPESKKGRK